VELKKVTVHFDPITGCFLGGCVLGDGRMSASMGGRWTHLQIMPAAFSEMSTPSLSMARPPKAGDQFEFV